MEMMQLLSGEQQKEQTREQQLAQCQDAIEKHEMETQFGIERSKAQKTIEKTMMRHNSEIKKLKQGYN